MVSCDRYYPPMLLNPHAAPSVRTAPTSGTLLLFAILATAAHAADPVPLPLEDPLNECSSTESDLLPSDASRRAVFIISVYARVHAEPSDEILDPVLADDVVTRQLRTQVFAQAGSVAYDPRLRAAEATARDTARTGSPADFDKAFRCALRDVGPEFVKLARLERAIDERSRVRHVANNLQRAAAANGVAIPLLEPLALLESTVRSRIEARQIDPLLLQNMEAQLALYAVAARAVHVAATRAAEQRTSPSPEIRERVRACPEARQPLDRYTSARIDVRRSAATDDYFPQDARKELVEGVVTLDALVSATGCVKNAYILVSAGDPRLDQAALKWALDGAVFTPAARNGEAVEMHTRFNLRFKLTD